MKKLILSLLRFYQKYLSLDNLGFHICRYSPTCSEYTHQAISKYGVTKGSFMGLLRVLRCNPLSKGGFDPVR